jgi:hypothetical protein
VFWTRRAAVEAVRSAELSVEVGEGFGLFGPNVAPARPPPVNVQVVASAMSSGIRAHSGSQEGGGAEAVRETSSGKEKRYD